MTRTKFPNKAAGKPADSNAKSGSGGDGTLETTIQKVWGPLRHAKITKTIKIRYTKVPIALKKEKSIESNPIPNGVTAENYVDLTTPEAEPVSFRMSFMSPSLRLLCQPSRKSLIRNRPPTREQLPGRDPEGGRGLRRRQFRGFYRDPSCRPERQKPRNQVLLPSKPSWKGHRHRFPQPRQTSSSKLSATISAPTTFPILDVSAPTES